MRKYVIVDGNPVLEPDILKWARWFEAAERRVDHTELDNGLRVSTVFLGIDHAFGEGPPVLWETMIFDGDQDIFQRRYTSLDDAKSGHNFAVDFAKARP